MNRTEIMEKLTELCQDIFDNDELEITDATVASDVKGWDSLTNLQLMSEIEDEFDITFSLGEVQNFKNVGELVDSIEKHIAE